MGNTESVSIKILKGLFMKRMFLPVVLASATVMASDVDNAEIQKRMADLYEYDFDSLIRDAQRYYRQQIERPPEYNDLIRSKVQLAACCYLLKQECEAKKLWQEVLETRPHYPEARVADLHGCDLYSLIRDAQYHYRNRIERLQEKNEQECVKNKMKLATCCYLLEEDNEAEKLWEEVIATGLNYPEAQVNLKELNYRDAIKYYDEAIKVSPKGGTVLLFYAKECAQKALEPSELYTLNQEKIKQLTEMFGIESESESESE